MSDVLHLAAQVVTTGTRHGSPSAIKRRLRQDHGIPVTFAEARTLLRHLEAVGIVGPVSTRTHAHPVFMNHEQALEALEATR